MKDAEETKKNEQSISKLWDDFKWPNIRVCGVPRGEERERKGCKKLEEIMIENITSDENHEQDARSPMTPKQKVS